MTDSQRRSPTASPTASPTEAPDGDPSEETESAGEARPQRRLKRKKASSTGATGAEGERRKRRATAQERPLRDRASASTSADGGASGEGPRIVKSLADPIKAELTHPRVVLLLVAIVGVGFLYVRNMVGDANRPYLLVALGVLGFLLGAATVIDPRRLVPTCGALTAIGLALVGTTTSNVGVAMCLAAGLGLAGGIHRLGRTGPDEALQAAEPEPKAGP